MCRICRNEVTDSKTVTMSCPDVKEINPDLFKNVICLTIMNCDNLEFIDLSACEKLKDFECSFCNKLKYINLSGCTEIEVIEIHKCNTLTTFPILEEHKDVSVLICTDCDSLTSFPYFDNLHLEEYSCYYCPWIHCMDNFNYNYNIRKLIELQRSFRRSLFRRRISMARILKELN
jgi:hypothetical protein